MNEIWIEYKGMYIMQLSPRAWGVYHRTGKGEREIYWELVVRDSLDKAMRWIDGN